MENAVEALKIAFAVFVFVIALSVSMNAIGQARATSDAVFYMTDKTNFYERAPEDKEGDARIVSGETIIPTLYRYYKENFNVIILDDDGEIITTYNLEEEVKKYNEDYRNAPWLGNANIDTKKRIDIDLYGESVDDKKNPTSINGVKYTGVKERLALYGVYNLHDYLKNREFSEMFLEQKYSGKEVVSEVYKESIELVKGNTKIWIIYKALN